MQESNKLPGKKTPKVEEPTTKKPSPSSPPIETPVPPQVMDPSALPHIEKEKPSTSTGKRRRSPSKIARKAK